MHRLLLAICLLVWSAAAVTAKDRAAAAKSARSGARALNALIQGITGSTTRAGNTDITGEEDGAPQMADGLFVFDLQP